MRFQIYKGADKKWYWRAVARNGRIIADGSQGYVTKYICKDRLKVFVGQAADAWWGNHPIEVL